MITEARRLEDIRPPSHREWIDIGRAVDQNLLRTLRRLTHEQWNLVTDCDPWTVKDIVSHVIAWPEASLNPKEMARQFTAGWRTRKDHGGTLHAQNEFQVTDRRSATPEELIARLERHQTGFHRLRNGLGVVGKVIPYKEQFTGTWVSLAFTVDAIFARDHFMHLLDIHRAAGSDPEIGPAEIRLMHDALREWAMKAGADVTLLLEEPAGGKFTHGTGERARITGPTLDLCRVLAGRKADTLEIEGDEAAARRWLTTLAVF